MVNSIGLAVTILEFTVKENGSKDGYPLQIKELRFTNTGTADTSDLRFVLEGPGSNNTIGTSSGTIVTFKDFGDIIVTDGDTTGKTYQVKVHVRSNIVGSTADNNTIVLKTSPVTDFDVAETSSNFLQSVASFQQSPGTAVDVVATTVQFKGTFNFGNVAVSAAFPGTPSVYATDANGRIDKNWSTAIAVIDKLTDCAGANTDAPGTLTNAGGGGLSLTPTQGVVTYTDLRYNATGSIQIYATSAGLIANCSSIITLP